MVTQLLRVEFLSVLEVEDLSFDCNTVVVYIFMPGYWNLDLETKKSYIIQPLITNLYPIL